MDAGDMGIMRELTYSALMDCEFSTYPYQDEAIDKIRSWVYEDDHKAGILQMATGAGKTVTVGILIRQLIEEGVISRALFAVHRTELVKQAIDTFELCGLMVGREQGSHHGFALGDPHVVCTTIQSMTKRCKRYQPDDFQLIITDEVHHAGESNKTYSSVYDHFPDAKLVGVTATIDRPDGQSLKRFEEVVYSYSLYDAIHDPAGPFLSPVKFVRCSLGVDLRGCKTTGKNGDFAQGDLGRKIQPAIELLANAISKEIEDRKKIIVFMPDVGSSIAMADALKQLGHSSDWVSGDKPDRDSTIQRYKNGLTKILVNCQILTEGFDDKPTDCVVLKPTRSRIAYAQMVGRGTRLCKGKSDCLILDFSHTTDMDLIGPSSLTDCEEVDSKRAEELVEEGVDLWQAVERAKTERKQRQEIKVPVARLDMSYRRVEINPFELAASLGVSRAMLTNANRFGELATPAQKDFLNKSGMADVNNMTKRQASQLIGQIIDRRNSGLCSIKQLNYLISLGMKPEKARGLQFGQAAEAIQKYRSNQAGSQE
jgi:superfamily II DNA or RNA helicase